MKMAIAGFKLIIALGVFLSFCKYGATISERGEPVAESYVRYFKMPGAVPKKDDDYLCTGMTLNSTSEEWIIKYEPLASANRAHHMLLYGCSNIRKKFLKSKFWDCGHHGVCSGSKIMFAWAKNAPGTHLPNDVGFRIGGNSPVKYLTLQIHYAKTLPEGVKDESGLKMTITKERQKNLAGIYLLVAGFVDIPPLTPKTHADVNCQLGTNMPEPINIFGFRVHAHALGSVITGYKYDPKTFQLTEIVKGNPQWPQAFYPMDSVVNVKLDEILHARCTYNSSTRNRHTYIGQTSNDEMCNLYLMYYTDRIKGSESGVCSGEHFPHLTRQLPSDSDEPLPANELLESMTKGENVNKDKEIIYGGTLTGTHPEQGSGFNAEKALKDFLNCQLDAQYNYIDNVYNRPYKRYSRRSLLPFEGSSYAYDNFYNSAYVPKSSSEQTSSQTYIKKFQMPGVTPTDHDAYICTPMILNATQEEWVVLFNPLASANRAHHMLLFGCSDVNHDFLQKGSWDCGHHGVCGGGRIMYAWAKNAPATHLPKDVGFRMGGSSGVNFLVLQIHYANPLPAGVRDTSGLEMTVTTTPQKYKAGIFLLAASYVDIPPFTEKTHADVNCLVGSTEPTDIFVFAFRVHAHKLGSVISGYTYDPQTNDLIEIAKGNPQWPQAFYPMSEVKQVKPSDLIHARCTYNSSGSANHTYIGSTASDEMCNLYLMYYTDSHEGSESGGCGGEIYHTLTAALPPSSDEPLPPDPLLEEMTHGDNRNKGKEVTYANVFVSEPPIEIEKKTQSRKDPERPGFSDYDDYPSYGSYDYRPTPYDHPVRGSWNPKLPQDYFNVPGRFGAENDKYGLKPKPVEVYDDDYGDNSANLGRVQYFHEESNKKIMDEHSKETLISSPKSGKQLVEVKGFHLVEKWGPANYKLGQVSAVAVDSRGDVIIFHRGDRVWDGSTFKGDEFVNQETPISQGTLLHLQRADGAIMHEWGANFFFMPHGLSLDQDDNLWLTDVGLHQVFKFPAGFGEGKALLALGTRFAPGTDDEHFCKPTGVAVLKNGEFFVSDGYCNSRILHYSADAKIIQKIGTESWSPGINMKSPPESSFRIPHALTLVEDHKEICVADRENGRVQCFKVDTGKFQREFKFKQWGRRIFSVAYTPHSGGRLYAVNGPQFLVKQKVEIYEINYTDGKLLTSFSPFNQGLSNPHDLALSSNGMELYVVEIGPNMIWKFISDSSPKNRSISSLKGVQQKLEVKTGQLQEASPNTLSLFSGGYSSLGVSSVVLGLVAMPIIVLSLLAIIMKCRRRGTRNRYLDNSKFINGLNGKHKSGVGLNLGSLLNKRHGFEQVATNDIDDDDLDSADSDVEEFSLTATKV